MKQQLELPDTLMIERLRDAYGLRVTRLDFLPLGADLNAAVYKAVAEDGSAYFLKVRRDESNLAGLTIPRYLEDRGYSRAVAPLPTKSGRLSAGLSAFTLILYPFVTGDLAAQVGMSDRQWIEFGSLVKRLHSSKLPRELSAQLPRERFIPKYADTVGELAAETHELDRAAPYQRELARFWNGRRREIDEIVLRAHALGRNLQASAADLVLCHADLHTHNVLIDRDDRLHVVDWDGVMLAPKERDLMFVTSSDSAAVQQHETLFFTGYGRATLDRVALAYYRYEWVVQEIGEYGAAVFRRDDLKAAAKEAAVHSFLELFEPDGVVEAAYASSSKLPHSPIEGRG
ncbi:MAG: aminoglycoside phosphotransferase family protein [Trueperaceae bacterium]|nr:MAG: aminoglycoside phosphotransferase family protein [Trueperaceae bacterium]